MTHEKAQKGDLIRAVVSCTIDGYNVGDILEVRQASEIAVSTECGSILNHGEYVIHRKAGEEDIDGDVCACASCGAELVGGAPVTAATIKYDTSYDATDEQIRMAIELGEQDAVNSPTHYTQGKFETIEIIEHLTSKYDDGFTAHCVGTAFKYMDRAPYKHESPTECLRKAAKYLEFAIERLDAKSTQ